MREVVLDTETTGLDPNSGDRVIEIGCLELENHIATGRTFHEYIHPERDIPEEAARIHGITLDMLKGKPLFAEVADAMVDFLGDAKLVIHNAGFDLGFLNAELARVDRPPIPAKRAIDTVRIARRKFPGSPASLDALCKRFNIDNSARTKHGALLDAELLADVYVELIGGKQPGLSLASDEKPAPQDVAARTDRPLRPARPHAATEGERAAHAAFVERLKDPIWRQ
jgi:DNA polymerase-3 subunit epsilon